MLVEQLQKSIEDGDAAAVADLLAEHAPKKKEIGKLTSRASIALQHCPRCGSGNVVAKLLAGRGKNLSTTEVGSWPVDPTFFQSRRPAGPRYSRGAVPPTVAVGWITITPRPSRLPV